MAKGVTNPSTLRNVSLLVLPTISYLAYRAMLVPLFAAMADAKAKGLPTPPGWQYIGHEGADKTLSLLINFFLQSFDNGRFAMMPEFIASIGPAAIVPTIEMRRSGYQAPTVFVSMLVLGFLYQNLGAGVIIPLWWAVHLWTSGSQTVPLQNRYADATVVGYFVGFVALSSAMIAYQSPSIIATWQFFPGWILLAQTIYLVGARVSPRQGNTRSPYATFQNMHIFNIVWSTMTHAYTLFQASKSSEPWDSLKDSYIPNYSSPGVDPAAAFSQEFCKWDLIYIAAATLFSGLWLMRGTKSRLVALGWFVPGSLFFGVGAGLSGVWMLKEKQLKESELPQKSKSK